MANVFEPEFDDPRDQPGFEHVRARLGRQAGTEQIGMSLFELPPGKAAYPYHWHVGQEELLIVLEGRPSLRAPDGWREMETGEVLPCLTGERGGHQLVNRTEERVRFLAISTTHAPDVCVYPDSGKVGVYRGPVGGGELYRQADGVDYFEGEKPPG